MKILITGSNGFVGKNLISQLQNIKEGKAKNFPLSSDIQILPYDIDTSLDLLDSYTKDCDFVVHLAGINRPKDPKEFMEGNFGFTSILLDSLKKYDNKAPIMISSSIQATSGNDYGNSKKAGEDLIFTYGKETGAKVLVYRLPNVFGKWCKPNYSSVIATFCHNIGHDLEITINDPTVNMKLVYIDDVVNEIIGGMTGLEHRCEEFCYIPTVHKVTVGEIAELLNSFKESRSDLSVPNLSNGFTKALYSTYLSYLPADKFSYPLKMNVDDRGSFTEILRTDNKGQISVNISKPGITKGNHWHNTKTEKFVVVKGKGQIRFRKIDTYEIIDYYVSGDKIEVVDIPTGYTHNIQNLGEDDMVTIMWCNECFDRNNPDTYFLEVDGNV